jgi:hypothetical protein
MVLNLGHWIEIQDRAHMAHEFFIRSVADHPAVIETPELAAAADKLSLAQGDFYQLVGKVRTDR